VVPVKGGIQSDQTADGGKDVVIPLKNVSEGNALGLVVTLRIQTIPRFFPRAYPPVVPNTPPSNPLSAAEQTAESGAVSQRVAAVSGNDTTNVEMHLSPETVLGAEKIAKSAPRGRRLVYRFEATYQDVSGQHWATEWGTYSVSKNSRPFGVVLVTAVYASP
jgi:hypothetical protein